MRVFSGSRLKAARLAAGKSREELSIDVGKSHPTIVSYETGRATPGADTLAKLADATQVDPGELFDVVDKAAA